MSRDAYIDHNSAARAAFRALAEIGDARTEFDELLTSEFDSIIELDPANGLTEYRDKQTTNNGATITEAPGEIKLSTGTTANGEAILDTAEKGRYQPGTEGLAGGAVRVENLSANGKVEIGYLDDENGYWLERRGDGTFWVGHRVGGTDKDPVPKDEWNGRDVDINLNHQTVVRFPFMCYYQGPLKIEVVEADPNTGEGTRKTIHRIGPTDGEPILEESKLPIRVRVTNGGDTEDNVVYVGGRHFGIRGKYNPNRRQTAEYNTSVSTSETLTSAVSFRKRDNYSDKAKSVKVSGLGVISDTDAVIEIHLNPTGLTDGNFGSVSDVPDSETAVESSTEETAITAGTVLDRALVSGGSGRRSNLAGIRRLGLDIPDDATVTVAIRNVSGTGTATVVFSLEEEW